jgi:hypothetical protein
MATTEIAASVAANQGPSPEASAAQGAEQLTDEQIIGLEPTAETAEPPEAEAAAEEQAPELAADSACAEATADAEAAKEEISQDCRTIPAELREVFKANPKLRDVWFSERAYREVFPTVRAAREMAELFPGGIEDAKLYRDGAETLRHLDGLYVSNSEESHRQLAKELAELAPEAYPNFVVQAVNQWAERDPEGYKGTLRATFEDELPGWAAEQGLPTHAQLLLQALEKGDTKSATALARQLVEWSRGIGQAKTETRSSGPDAEIERLRAQLAERDARDQQRLEETLRATVTERYVAEVKGFLEKAVPTASQRARDRMVGDIVNAINQQLAESPGFMAQLNQLKAEGRVQKVADFVIGRAKQLLPQAGRRVLNEWTSEILAANKTAVQKKAAAAQSRDAGAGASPAGRAPGKPRKIDYAKASDIDILNS